MLRRCIITLLLVGLVVPIAPAISAPLATAYSQVTNNSGRTQPVLDGATGQPISIGNQPWTIASGETIFSHAWGSSPRFTFDGQSYHYLGSVGSPFRFFIVPDWGTEVTPTQEGSGAPVPYVTVSNNSGRPLPVLDGASGLPINMGGRPWTIAPGESILSHHWGDSPRFVYGGRSYHYIGSVGGSSFRFFLVEDWTDTPGSPPPPSSGGLFLANYYAWFDPENFTNQYVSDIPVSPYNSDDTSVMARHVDQAKSVGIDAFAVAWFGPGNRTDRNFAQLLNVARDRGFQVTISFQMHQLPNQTQESILAALRYIATNYAGHPGFLRYQGRPVLVFSDMPRVPTAEGQTPQDAWQALRQQVDPQGSWIWIAEGLDPSYLRVFDGIYVLKIDHRDFPNDYVKLPRWGQAVRSWAATLGQPKLWVATIQPGWDDTRSADAPGGVRVPSPPFARDREGGAYYARTFDYAMQSRPDWLMLHSFNEWVEGSQIEPSVSYGDLYLNLTRDFARRFKGG